MSNLDSQILADMAQLVGADGLEVSATFKPQNSDDEATWLTITLLAHAAEDPLAENDDDLIAVLARRQRFSLLRTAVTSLGRVPASGDRLVIAAGEYAGEWRLQYCLKHLYWYELNCISERPIGAGSSQARRIRR